MISNATKALCAVIFFFHLAASHIVLPGLGKGDLYPFYTWDLFSFTDRVIEVGAIRVLSYDGVTVADGEGWVFKNRHFFAGKKPYLVPHQINRLAKYLSANEHDQAHAEELRAEMEKNLFRDFNVVEYEIFFSPIDVRQTVVYGTPPRNAPLAAFRYEKGR